MRRERRSGPCVRNPSQPIARALGTAAILACACLPATPIAAERTKILDEGGIAKYWTLAEGARLVAPGYPAAFADRGDNVCIAMGYAIRRDGSTSDFTLLKAWSDAAADREPAPGYWDAFAAAGAQALAQWKFAARPDTGSMQTAYTVSTMHFSGNGGMAAAELNGHCRIDDLAGFIQRQKADRFYTGRDKHDQERLRRQIEDKRLALAGAAARAKFEKRAK